jgi:hypothetical protein
MKFIIEKFVFVVLYFDCVDYEEVMCKILVFKNIFCLYELIIESFMDRFLVE